MLFGEPVKTYSQSRERPPQAERIPYPHNTEHHRKFQRNVLLPENLSETSRTRCLRRRDVSLRILRYCWPQSQEHHAIDLLEERGVESWHEAFEDLSGKDEKQPVSVRTNTGTLGKLLTGEMALSA